MESEADIAIAGGGIAGLTLARALAQRGRASRVFERRVQLGDRGGALLLSASALRCLARLGLADAVLKLGTAMEAVVFRRPDGASLMTLDLARACGPSPYPFVCCPRRELLELLSEVPFALHRGQAVTGFHEETSGVQVLTSTGQVHRSRLLVGADGLRSQVRAQLFGPAPYRKAGQQLWLGMATVSHPELPPGRGLAGLGRGLRCFAASLPGGRVYWYAVLSRERAVADLAALAKCFSGWRLPIETLIAHTDPNTVASTAIRDRRPRRPWHAGRVVLIGDAVHPVTPDLGQGASQAIESALCLADHLATTADVRRAMADYESQRYRRTARIANMSFITAASGLIDAPAMVGLRDLGVAALLPPIAQREFAWLAQGFEPT